MNKKEYFISISDWMIRGLNLSGYQLLIYGIIFGFSMDEKGSFSGSISYLCNRLNATKPAVIAALKELVEKGFIERSESVIDGKKCIRYKTTDVRESGKETLPNGKETLPSKETLPVKKLYQGGKETLPDSKETLPEAVKKLYRNGKETLPNTKETKEETKVKTKVETKVSAFDALDELLSRNVDEQTAKDFLILRKTKKAPLTLTAIEGLQREAGKAGITLSTALQIACSNGWQGFKAEWINKTKNGSKTIEQFHEETNLQVERLRKKIFGKENAI